MLRKTFLLAVTMLLLGHASPSRAGLIVEIESISVNPDFSSSFVDVWIRSEDSATPVTLSSFGFELLITASSGTQSFLSFADPQPDPQLNDPNFHPLYVFADDSVNVEDGFSMGSVGETVYSGDTFIGGDDSILGGVSITTRRLLARMQLDSGLLPFSIGDMFTIGVVENSNSTFFLDPDFEKIEFESISGTVSVVPEPSSLVLVLSCLPVMALAGWRARSRERRGRS